MRVGNRYDAEDILQEAWKKACSSYHPNKQGNYVGPWIMTIIDNNIKNYYKKKKKYNNVSLDKYHDIPASSPSATVLSIFLRSLLESDFNVPDELLKYLMLSAIDGVPLTDISEKTNIPYTKLRYWKEKFLEELKEKWDDENIF